MSRLLLLTGLLCFGFSAAAAANGPAPLPEPVFVIPQADPEHWNRFYAGVSVGYGLGGIDIIQWDEQYDFDGFIAAAQVGYNVDMWDYVVGIEGDIAWSGMGGVDIDREFDVTWLATLRGRLGVAVNPSMLVYGTAGLAVAGAEAFGGVTTQAATHIGWTAGLGVEVMVTDAISVKGDYLYADLGEATYDFSPSGEIDIALHTVRAGINFHF